MSERGEILSTEEKVAVVDSWVEVFAETGKVGFIERQALAEVLEYLGADFLDRSDNERRKQLRTLAGHSNKDRASGMRVVWGSRYDEYVAWTESEIAQYEESKGKLLPHITQKGWEYKYSGMIQFFGRLTAFADGHLSWFDFKSYLEASAQNGRMGAEGVKGEKARIWLTEWLDEDGKKVEKTSQKRPASIPPGFPKIAWVKIKSFRE